jgi:hypothetical protein
MLKRAATVIAMLFAFSLAAPVFARPGGGSPAGTGSPMSHTAPGEQAVDTAKAAGEEKGLAKGEQHGRTAHQDKKRGETAHQDKHRGQTSPKQ